MLTISDVGNDARYGASRSKSYIDGVMSAESVSEIGPTSFFIALYAFIRMNVAIAIPSGVTMGWLLRLVTGGPSGKGAPDSFIAVN